MPIEVTLSAGQAAKLVEKTLSKKNIEILEESKTALQEYTDEIVSGWGKKADVAVCMFVRRTGEGADRPIEDFELKEESDGTQRVFDFIPMAQNVKSQADTYVIDEIDRSLHPILVKALVLPLHILRCLLPLLF